MWKYFESRYGTTAKDEQIAVLPVATNAAWDRSNKTLRLMEMYKWGDWMPSNAWQYAPHPNKTISDGYQYFLKAALIALLDSSGSTSPEIINATRRSVEAVDFARSEYNKVQAEAQAAYDAYVPGHPIPRKSRRDYFHDQGWDAQISAKSKALRNEVELYVSLTASIKNPDIDLIQRAQGQNS